MKRYQLILCLVIGVYCVPSFAGPILDINFIAPASVQAGESANVSWTVGNIGDETATGPWVDAIYLSTDNLFQFSDIRLTTFDRFGDLAPGDTYTRTESILIPMSTLAGEYFLLAATDIEEDVSGPDFASRAIQITAASVPEPSTLGLLGAGLLGFAFVRHRRAA